MRTDLPDGTTVELGDDGKWRLWRGSLLLAERDLTVDEVAARVQVLADAQKTTTDNTTRDSLAAGIADLQAALAVAGVAVTTAQNRSTTATAWQTQQTARAVTVRAVTSPTNIQLRDELGLIYDRLAELGGHVAAMSSDQAQAARGIGLAYTALIGLAQLVQRRG